MEAKKTKRELILDAALTLFSEKGYDGVGVDEIGDAVGMKGPALYYYFKGKDAILDALLAEAEAYYQANFGSAVHIELFPESLDELIESSLKRLEFTIHDSRIRKVRRMLAMEQFRNERIRKLTTQHHLTGIEEMNRRFLEKLIAAGRVKSFDPALLAFELTAPATMMVHLIDREPDREEEAIQRIREHFQHFKQVYAAGEKA